MIEQLAFLALALKKSLVCSINQIKLVLFIHKFVALLKYKNINELNLTNEILNLRMIMNVPKEVTIYLQRH